MNTEHYYDLDGTLSQLNSTYDFIFDYYKKKKKNYSTKRLQYIFYNKIPFMKYVDKRTLIINSLFRGLNKTELEEFFESDYKKRFLSSLTPLGEKILKDKTKNDILLTGCTEIPAKQIAKIFSFKKIICTEFTYKNGMITGIKTDTYGNKKVGFVKTNKNTRNIYYTNDFHTESKLRNVMDEVHEVDK